jgi:hypothetical protein
MNRKLRQPSPGEPKPPLTKLKELPVTQRDSLMDILRDRTYGEASPLVSELVGFPCSAKVLSKFFPWQQSQESLEGAEDLLDQIVAFEKQRHPDWPVEKARALATTFFMRHAMEKRDLKEFATAARLSLQNEEAERNAGRLELQQLKLEESQRTKLEVGLKAIGRCFRKNPEALKLYQQARSLVEKHYD